MLAAFVQTPRLLRGGRPRRGAMQLRACRHDQARCLDGVVRMRRAAGVGSWAHWQLQPCFSRSRLRRTRRRRPRGPFPGSRSTTARPAASSSRRRRTGSRSASGTARSSTSSTVRAAGACSGTPTVVSGAASRQTASRTSGAARSRRVGFAPSRTAGMPHRPRSRSTIVPRRPPQRSSRCEPAPGSSTCS